MKIVHFIVNPIAGKGKSQITKQYLSAYFEKNYYSIVVKHSSYKGHATLLVQQSINEKAEIIVACGGDGTINEVASCLVNSKILLGIIPIGSGNGLARNLKIPKNINKAIQRIKGQKATSIDVGRINGEYFFSNIGFGFAANTISNFESSSNRRLITYLRATLQSIRSFKNDAKYTIEINGKEAVLHPFLVFVSNTNIMGYNFSITRKAILNDGFLDVVIIDRLNKFKILYLTFLFLLRSEHKIKEYSYHRVENATMKIENQDIEIIFELDGELRRTNPVVLHLEVLKESLKVIA
ncbi:diacylglycerol kinase family lipid kinase [Maribacter polysiphoniae]|uniref:Diacylglycerol kinase family lipid kinase n=1 Tax=Maribacter polysiphoniae TaxID=429344 RepID=A0A316E612_9FLAO|nr:diacylglycerol kinase family protein [Maribacter polysiphoniae]MBD1260368.1 diacylglycerol kinase family lipid kinase [Maribacter polysiphoniae]PWK25831.1 YegS/Rv2252/BmrU family lipid kinase [Maribacter polysiphoniae]